MPIFGAAFDISTDRWVAFNEDFTPDFIIGARYRGRGAWMPAADTRNAKGDVAMSFHYVSLHAI